MTQKQLKSRTALTAIAAVIALSSTPVLAQDASVPDPLVDSTPVSTASDPLAPEPATTSDTAPVDSTATKQASEPAPAATKPATTRKSASAARSSAAPVRSPSTARQAEAPAPAPAATADTPAEAPLASAPAAPSAEPVAPPTPVAGPAEQNLMADDALPIAGAAGLGLIALGGAGLVMRRRKRRREEEEFAERQWALDHSDAEPAMAQPEPIAVAAEPAFVRAPAPMHDPVGSDAPATALPKGFDLSRFGRHVQAAYRGPTPDNPSLSLKNRLRRASFFDQQERRAAQEAPSVAQQAPSAKPAWAARKPNEAEFMFRPARPAPVRKPKPAFQG